jgi:phosphoribosylanthranilate isomerase
MTRIKVSGIVQPEDAAAAAQLGVEMVACVFNAQSPRYVTLQQAWAVRRAMPRQVRFVGVFVDTPVPVVQQMAYACQLDLVQLFGDEPRADLESLGTLAYKTVTVTDPEAIEATLRRELGRRPRRHDGPTVHLHFGGAAAMAWDRAAPTSARLNLVLSGSGLNAGTVAQAIAQGRPWAVDVWDAVESEPGRLDPARLEAFIRAVRAADEQPAPAPNREATP